MELIDKPYKYYSKNMTDLVTYLEFHRNKLNDINFNFDILKEKESAILNAFYKMNIQIKTVSNHTLSTLECLNTERKRLDIELKNLAEELTRLVQELNKYYETINI